MVNAVVKKILIVDDSQAEVHLMQSMLQQGGFHSVGISDPTRIEDAIEEERPNVILLDVVMPQRNGFQACRELKSQDSYSQIPVILVTSRCSPSDSKCSTRSCRRLLWSAISSMLRAPRLRQICGRRKMPPLHLGCDW